MINVEFPEKRYYKGSFCWDNELPYLVRGAMFLLDEIISKSMTVLEFGSGGSTFFFARRTKGVVSFETDPGWFVKVGDAIKKRNIKNIDLRLGYGSFKKFVRSNKKFNCVLIDPNRSINRDLLLDNVMDFVSELSILILDNYANSNFFPRTHALVGQEFIDKYLDSKWVVQTFDHPMWNGGGTRIFYRDLFFDY